MCLSLPCLVSAITCGKSRSTLTPLVFSRTVGFWPFLNACSSSLPTPKLENTAGMFEVRRSAAEARVCSPGAVALVEQDHADRAGGLRVGELLYERARATLDQRDRAGRRGREVRRSTAGGVAVGRRSRDHVVVDRDDRRGHFLGRRELERDVVDRGVVVVSGGARNVGLVRRRELLELRRRGLLPLAAC